MDKQSVISFFDKCAADWDNLNIQNSIVVNKILELAQIKEGIELLDVACGTGVLFDDYIKRGINDFTAIDISLEMVRICKEKYKKINILCGDAEKYCFNKSFDNIMIFNAFPHFVNPEQLFANLVSQLNDGGRLTVAHGASREDILKCHSGSANHISYELPEAENLADFMKKYINIDIVISDNEKYVVSGIKNNYN